MDRHPITAQGFSWRKRRLLRQFLDGQPLRFIRAGAPAPEEGDLLLWGAAAPAPHLSQRVRVVRVEDGFLRSVGLGADLVRPLSWVFDRQGLHYDPSTPSDLECLLAHTPFDRALVERAVRLRERIVAGGLTKYNLAGPPWQAPAGRPVVLVIGQVESDAAIAAGTARVRTNLGLLAAVRACRPDAWLVYKPHPDVVAGLRRPGTTEARALDHCDEVVTAAALEQMLPQVDEVHVMTSLAGFEALLRNRPVTCWGRPFYAGWGLTDDREPIGRRHRRLALDELVAAALILYPRYLDPVHQRPCSPEAALTALEQMRQGRPLEPPPWRRWLRPWLARP